MMKKVFAVMLVCALMLTSAALAAPVDYKGDDDLSFTYDSDAFEMAFEDKTDDELTVVLDGTKEDWGEYAISFYLSEIDDEDSTFPTPEEFAELEEALGIEVTQGEWNSFKNVYSYAMDEDGVNAQTFIVPLYDDDDANEIESALTVTVYAEALENAEAAQLRDDAISAVLDTLNATED